MKTVKLFMLFTCVTFSLFVSVCSADNDMKYYKPALSELKGTIKMLTFPGRPNYEDINDGDEPEKCPYLILDHAIDVSTQHSKSTDFHQPFDGERNVRIVQLAIGSDADWKLMKDSNRVLVKGELFDAFTGHHRTRVLLSVTQAKLLKVTARAGHKKIYIQSTCPSGLYDIVSPVKECSAPLCRCFTL